MRLFLLPARRAWLWLGCGAALAACATGTTLDNAGGDSITGASGSGSGSDVGGAGASGGASSQGGDSATSSAGMNPGAAGATPAGGDGGEGGAPGAAGTPGGSAGAPNGGGMDNGNAGGGSGSGGGGMAGADNAGAPALGGADNGGSPSTGGDGGGGGVPGSGGQPPANVNACANANWTANAVPYCQTGMPDCNFAETARLPQYGIDGDIITRFASGQPKAGGEYFTIIFPETVSVSGLNVISTDTLDAAEAYELRYSTDGTTFLPFNPAVTGAGAPTLNITFPATQMRALRFIQAAADTSADPKWWTVHEFQPQNCVDQVP